MVNLIDNEVKINSFAVIRQWLEKINCIKEVLHLRLTLFQINCAVFFWYLENLWYFSSMKMNQIPVTIIKLFCQNFIHSAWDLLAHTSGELNHINGAGRRAGTVPKQSGLNEGKLQEREASLLHE